MTTNVWILVFAGLSVSLGVCLYIAMSKNAALQVALQTTRQELKNYSPIIDVDLEVSGRRQKVEAEIAAAMQQIGAERQELDAEINRKRQEMESQISTANRQLVSARQDFEAEVNRKRQNVESEIMTLNGQLVSARQELAATEALLKDYELKLDMEEMGFYQPKFEFEDSLKYAEALDLTREAQKELVKQKLVMEGVVPNTTTAMKRLGVLGVDAFNGEASTIISAVTYRNFEASKEKLRAEFDKTNRLLEATGMRISQKYLELKVKEMAIAYEYKEVQAKAKEEQAEIKEMMREEEDAREEAEGLREKAMEEERRYQQALATAREELASHAVDDRQEYEKKIQELETQLQNATAERERATSMAQITKKGHVYIISNLGSFGEGVFKIGLTRRTEPDERIRELGDASGSLRI